MKSTRLAALFFCLLFGSLQISAHHAAQAQFDVEKIEALSGKLTKIEMINPHPQLYFTVAGDEGEVAWRVEAPAIAALRRMGILRSLRVGQTYKVDYFPSRDGSPIALMGAITDSEGRRFGGTFPPGVY